MMSPDARVLYFDSPGKMELRTETLAAPQPGQVQVRTHCSAISPGTEMLFFRGQVPGDLALDATIPGMEKPPVYPLRYGYACVGDVCAVGDDSLTHWLHKRVFAFQPHASHFNTAPATLLPIPDNVTTDAAALFPNMETALSLVHDGAPLAGERVLIFGQGIVGLLVTWLLASYRSLQLATVEPMPARRARSQLFGAHMTLTPEQSHIFQEYNPDLIFELTGNPAALRAAVTAAGYHARIIVGSWYGTKPVELALGQSFHRNRISLYSSQVSTIPAPLSARWDKARRYETAWSLLAQLPCADLITHRFEIESAQRAFSQIDNTPADTCQVLLTYAGADK